MRHIQDILKKNMSKYKMPKHTNVIKALDCIKVSDVKRQPWRRFVLSGLPEDSDQQKPSADVPAQNKLEQN